MEVHIIEVPLVGGGFYERMIQLVKRILRKVLGNARLTHDELYTILVEVECTVNSRLLTYVSTILYYIQMFIQGNPKPQSVVSLGALFLKIKINNNYI